MENIVIAESVLKVEHEIKEEPADELDSKNGESQIAIDNNSTLSHNFDIKQEVDENEEEEKEDMLTEVKPPLAIFLEHYEDVVERENIFEMDPLMADAAFMDDLVVPGSGDNYFDSPIAEELFSDHMGQKRSFPKRDCSRQKKTSIRKELYDSDQTGDKVFSPRKEYIEETDDRDLLKRDFINKNELSNHTKKQSLEKALRCDGCSKSFLLSSSHIEHKSTHTEKEILEKYLCPKCLGKNGNVMIHNNNCTNDRLYKCDICTKTFNLRHNLSVHKKTHFLKPPLQCDICKKSVRDKWHLSMHMVVHTGKKLHQCEICKRGFKQKSALSKHMNTHTREKPHKCDICKRCFKSPYYLSKHMNIHTNVTMKMAYQCDICKKIYWYERNLCRHMKIHTGERPHQCDMQKEFIVPMCTFRYT